MTVGTLEYTNVVLVLTLWLRSVTPADLKSGNLMPAVSGTVYKKNKSDKIQNKTPLWTLDILYMKK